VRSVTDRHQRVSIGQGGEVRKKESGRPSGTVKCWRIALGKIDVVTIGFASAVASSRLTARSAPHLVTAAPRSRPYGIVTRPEVATETVRVEPVVLFVTVYVMLGRARPR